MPDYRPGDTRVVNLSGIYVPQLCRFCGLSRKTSWRPISSGSSNLEIASGIAERRIMKTGHKYIGYIPPEEMGDPCAGGNNDC